jgi:hypothetical protein
MASSYQVWAKDRYGRHEVLSALSTKGKPESEWLTPEEALAAAKRYVHDKNRNNSLTFDEQKRGVTHLVAILNENAIYSGNLVMGRHTATVKIASGGWNEARLKDGIAYRFYLGQTPDDTPWMLETPRKQAITDINDLTVADKTLVFVHPQ